MIGCAPLCAQLCAQMGHMFYCAPLFIYCDVTDVDTDAHAKDNYVYRPLVKYKNYLPLTWIMCVLCL